MLIDENARVVLRYIIIICNEGTNAGRGGWLVQHEVLSPTRLVCHFYDAYECNNCIRRGTAAGERWKMRRGERKKGGGGGIGTTRTGFVPKVGGGAGRCLVILCMICTRATPPSCALPFSVVPSLLPSSSSPLIRFSTIFRRFARGPR